MLATAVFVVAFIDQVLERPLNYSYLAVIISFGVVSTIASLIYLRKSVFLSDIELLSQLTIDAILLILLVAFSGGASNPFIYYYLVLIGISAAIFRPKLAWLFCISAIVAYSVLMYKDLAHHAHAGFSDFQLHLLGMWFNFVGSSSLLCLFVARLATALKDREHRLSLAKEENLKNEQLIGMGTLAASTAHHLGSPLSTMAILLEEIENEDLSKNVRESTELLKAQVDRCANSLVALNSIAEQNDSSKTTTTLAKLFEDIEEHYLLFNSKLFPSISICIGSEHTQIQGGYVLRHALINLIDNAIQAAKSSVHVYAERAGDYVKMTIADDGDGLSAGQHKDWGKIVFTTKKQGFGIGALLANSTIEKLNGTVSMADKTAGQETVVSVLLPVFNTG